MAFNPYFRYETTSLDLASGTFAPSFPVPYGVSLHSYATEKPTYTVTNRLHGTTRVNLESESVKPADKDTIYDFWNTTLSDGEYSFTVIDNRSRMLFETYWNIWEQNWKKQRGGINDIPYNLQSPCPWTPPVYGAYLMSDDTLNNHTLQGSNLSTVDGTLVDNAASAIVLRETGSALLVTDNPATVQTGATGSISWDSGSKENSIGLFCQAYITDALSLGRVYFMELVRGTNIYRLSLDAPRRVIGQLGTVSSPHEVRKGASDYHEMTADTWYDLAFTYDALTEQNYLYVVESGDTSFTDFQHDATASDDQVGLYGGNTQLGSYSWDTLNLIQESVATAIPAEQRVFVQNAMVFNGYLSGFDFNTIRRLCWLWNKKTIGTWPK